MDILPGFSNKNAGDTVICVPDRKLQDWTVSNPKGYTTWFLDISSHIVAREDFAFAKSSLETKEFEKINSKTNSRIKVK